MSESEAIKITTSETTIFLLKTGSGPALLLLHGFPENHLMWRDITPLLAQHFTVICADLRGYGRSGCPPSDRHHMPYSKRAMANDFVFVMKQLGFSKFFVAGHDRGGRVAYRLALDHPESVKRLALLDIITTLDVWDRADKEFAISFWPWILLSQPKPLPERLISAAPDAIIDNALSNWGTSQNFFPSEIREAYLEVLKDETHAHAICEEYRAAATIDYIHDLQDRKSVRRINCPLFLLWSANGPLENWYKNEGGPLELWHKWANDVQGKPISGGHFFPEELPEETANALKEFFLK